MVHDAADRFVVAFDDERAVANGAFCEEVAHAVDPELLDVPERGAD